MMSSYSNQPDDYMVALIAAHQADLTAFINSLLPGDPSVADVLQQTNMVLWRKRQSFEQGTNFLAWAFSVARWEVRAHQKQRKRRSWLVFDDDLTRLISDAAKEEAEVLPMVELREALEKCMVKLKPQERDLITHRYFTDAPLKEYASRQSRPVTSLKTSLARIRASLRRCIESAIRIESVTGGGQT